MPFKVSDFHDLVELLETHPQWRAQLRRLVLSRDVLALPRIVQELAEAQKRTEAQVRELAVAQQRTEARVTRLETVVQELAEAQQRTEAQVRELAAAQQRTEQRVEELAEAQKRTEAQVRELAAAQQRTEQRVEELAEAQKRTEAQVRELAAAQQRTEQRVEELAEAQKRTEAQVRELAAAQQRTEARVEELAAAQQRTEQRVTRLETVVQELAEAQKETRQELGRLSNRIGVTIEEEAGSMLRLVLERKGYRALRADYRLALDGEVDVVLPLHDPQGQPVWAVLEAKVRLSGRAVEAWAQRMRDPNFQAALREAGVVGPYLVYAYGMRLDESARDAAQQFGIGLLSSRGEEVPPTAPLSV